MLHWRDASRATLDGCGLPVPARHPRAAVRQGGDRHRLAAAGRRSMGVQVERHPAGAARRVVRQLPVPGQRRADRAGAEGRRVLRIVSAGNVAGEGAKMTLLSAARARGGAGVCWRRCATSSSPTAPTSTTGSSTCSPSPAEAPRHPGRRASRRPSARRRAGRRGRLRRDRPARRRRRRPARLAGRRPPAAAAAAQPAGADRRRGRARGRELRRRYAAVAVGLRRLRHLRRARRGLRPPRACARLRGDHCYDVFAGPGG